MKAKKIELRFWGVRGSLPTPGPTTLEVGGNTTCITLQCDDYIVVFDAGTGLNQFGKFLDDEDQHALRGSILFTHYHWDHIQGLPFFMPARRKENRFRLYGEAKDGIDLQDILQQQMQQPFFPVDMDEQEALVTFIGISPGESFEPVDDLTVSTMALRHNYGSIGYRVDKGSISVCLITDHEHPADSIDEAVVDFAQKATVLIHDGQYSPEEKRGPKAGWGHSSWEEAAITAKAANVEKLYITHHDPSRTDEEVFAIEARAREIFANTEIATESTVLELFP